MSAEPTVAKRDEIEIDARATVELWFDANGGPNSDGVFYLVIETPTNRVSIMLSQQQVQSLSSDATNAYDESLDKVRV